ncbi:EAL domain-containing protein [uncultured Hyphomonas sp.]|jgi:diguanylate cyclase (GGDEF)-like protein|uniref:putative bifunctional diguanylate cyclase/phosphodiesterase n=1 Tax=uncultured Hyphomonas sp. TaxID=225298 RepID=UPI000C67DF9A|nr:GGDEF-domain containing protein [Hyphomonadaceae bacterium]|tara:strand:- start:109980 stop:111575 length:1596 start_codon:yes stop_codon:yes gene_type:complete
MPHTERKLIERSLQRARNDAILIGGITVFLLILAIQFDAFELVAEYSRTHEAYELDELLIVMMILPPALLIYVVRRAFDMAGEISSRRTAEANAKMIALHDALTGLANRRKAMAHLTTRLPSADRYPVTIAGVDLNRFKAVNDLYGHNAGDTLLVRVSERLKAEVGHLGMVSRMGGDEFVVILEGAADSEPVSRVLNSLTAIFKTPFDLGDMVCSVGASIGVSQAADPKLTAEEFLSQADVAMYRNKGSLGVALSFYEPGMEEVAKSRALMEAELRQALKEKRIEPFYQPVINLGTGEVIGYEALARWRTETGSLHMPEDFIPIAEQSGLISSVFLQVLKKACVALRDQPPHMTLAVNLSPVQFNDEWLAEQILAVLVETGVAPGRLEVEITENALVANFEAAQKIMQTLKSQGIKIALDDFGTGYSSFRHLNELPFDKIKIDRSFISGIDLNESSRTIVRAVTELAHNLGLTVTAEGVELLQQIEMLQEIGCDFGQGYLYGRADVPGGRDDWEADTLPDPAPRASGQGGV